MKRIVILLMCLVLSLSAFAACANDGKADTTTTEPPATTTQPETTAPETTAPSGEITADSIFQAIKDAIGEGNLTMGQAYDDTLLENFYSGLKKDDFIEIAGTMPMMNVTAEEFFIVKVSGENRQKTLDAIDKHLADLDATWSQYLPNVYKYVKDARIIEKDDYVILIVSENADTAASAVDELFGE